jgi:uncharacterized protein (DUF58 family)
MHNFNIVYITLFTVFSVASSGCYFGRKNLYDLTLTELPQERIFANKKATLKWRLTNKADNPAYDVTIKSENSTQLFKTITKESIVDLTHTFEKRGKNSYPELTIESRFPLLHVWFFKPYDPKKTLLVYPEPKGVSLQEYIDEQLSNHGERSDFEGIRRYEKSDSASVVHWPSLAKGGDLMSRNFSYLAKIEGLNFEFLSCADNDEDRLSQLCLWVLECEKQGFEFSIKMPQTTYSSKKESVDEILQKLAQY